MRPFETMSDAFRMVNLNGDHNFGNAVKLNDPELMESVMDI